MVLSIPYSSGRVEAEKSYLQPALWVKAPWAGGRHAGGSPSGLIAAGISHSATSSPAGLAPTHSSPRPPARGDVIARRRGSPTHRPRTGSRKSGEPSGAVSRNRGRLITGTSAERRQETAGMREAAGSAGALLDSPAGGDPVLPVGAGGASWDVLAAGEKGQKKEMGREPASGRAGVLLGWGGAGWTDPAARLC